MTRPWSVLSVLSISLPSVAVLGLHGVGRIVRIGVLAEHVRLGRLSSRCEWHCGFLTGVSISSGFRTVILSLLL